VRELEWINRNFQCWFKSPFKKSNLLYRKSLRFCGGVVVRAGGNKRQEEENLISNSRSKQLYFGGVASTSSDEVLSANFDWFSSALLFNLLR